MFSLLQDTGHPKAVLSKHTFPLAMASLLCLAAQFSPSYELDDGVVRYLFKKTKLVHLS